MNKKRDINKCVLKGIFVSRSSSSLSQKLNVKVIFRYGPQFVPIFLSSVWTLLALLHFEVICAILQILSMEDKKSI